MSQTPGPSENPPPLSKGPPDVAPDAMPGEEGGRARPRGGGRAGAAAVSSAAVIGIDLDPVAAHIARYDPDDDEAAGPAMFEPDATMLPPSVLLPQYAGEPVQVDLAWPVHPRASGDHWPPEARMRLGADGPAPARMPMAYAWPMLAGDMTWHWQPALDESRGERTGTITAAQAIAHLAAGAAETAHAAGDGGADETILVVPTHLGDGPIRKLQTAMKRLGRSLRLCRRALAAATVWAALMPRRAARRAHVASLHLGLDEWELTLLELRPAEGSSAAAGGGEGTAAGDGGEGRPRLSIRELLVMHLPSPGFEMLHRVAEQTAQMMFRQSVASRAWELLWCSPWLATAFSLMHEGDAAAIPPELGHLSSHVRKAEFLRQQCRAAMQRAPGVGPEVSSLLRRYRPHDGGYPAAREWIGEARSALSRAGVVIDGAVVTGPFAPTPWDARRSFAAFHLDQLRIAPHAAIIETADVPPGLLARGAALHA